MKNKPFDIAKLIETLSDAVSWARGNAAVERMEAVSEGIRSAGVSQATHVHHMAGHLAQHAKIARAAIAKAEGRQE